MLRTRNLLTLVAILLIFQACHKRGATENTATQNPMAKALISSSLPDTASAPVTIDSLKVSGQQLIVTVSYSGGCENHSFDLYFDGMYAKSLPAQATLQLYHRNNGDACRSLISEELRFDLSSMKPPGGKSIILKVGGHRAEYHLK
jgi:hypothetical protein